MIVEKIEFLGLGKFIIALWSWNFHMRDYSIKYYWLIILNGTRQAKDNRNR